LVEISVARQPWDVSPEVLTSLEASETRLSFTNLDYSRHIGVLESYGTKSSPWLRHLLVHWVGEERNRLESHCNGKLENPGVLEVLPTRELRGVRKVLHKLNRETKRILRQGKALYRRV
jgi:hypothetical protein